MLSGRFLVSPMNIQTKVRNFNKECSIIHLWPIVWQQGDMDDLAAVIYGYAKQTVVQDERKGWRGVKYCYPKFIFMSRHGEKGQTSDAKLVKNKYSWRRRMEMDRHKWILLCWLVPRSIYKTNPCERWSFAHNRIRASIFPSLPAYPFF